jgi:acetoin utilization deacetylase AcuC-like enzyme
MQISTEGYGRLTAAIRTAAQRADAALGFVLEGGYGLDTLSDSVRMVHRVFDGYEPTDDDTEPEAAARRVLATVREQGFGEA